jgi:hypothetical protein
MNCENKNIYQSEYAAIKIICARIKSSCYGLRTYYCTKCKGWHITHQQKYIRGIFDGYQPTQEPGKIRPPKGGTGESGRRRS